MNNKITWILILLMTAASFVHAQDDAQPAQNESFDSAAAKVEKQLEDSLKELAELRKQMAEQTIPMSRKLSELESELGDVRRDYKQTTRILDSRTLDLSNLRTEIKSRREEATYLSNLLGEYIRNFESRLHIAEIQRYRKVMGDAKLALENSNLSEQEVYQIQVSVINASLDRLNDALGGTKFEGTAIDANGLVNHGEFLMVGPAALFRSKDGANIGTAEQRLGSLEPAIIAFGSLEDAAAADQLVSTGKGNYPLDPTLGNAHKIEATQESFLEHVQKGGPVMVPIFALAGAALLAAIYKWIDMAFIRKPSTKRVNALLQAVANHDKKDAMAKAKKVGGPTGKMLAAGVEHIKEPRELIEEVMFEAILATKLRLQKLLPFIAISAASAPLLGLLGTVTGIINTFKLITVFGSGDVKTLSGGISEALITTKFGLIVAIPSLLIHAFLSRKAKGIVDQMEKSAIAFVNQIAKTPYEKKNDKEEKPAEPVKEVKVEAPKPKADDTEKTKSSDNGNGCGITEDAVAAEKDNK